MVCTLILPPTSYILFADNVLVIIAHDIRGQYSNNGPAISDWVRGKIAGQFSEDEMNGVCAIFTLFRFRA